MTNIEHLVENGIYELEHNIPYKKFLTEDYNNEMLKNVSATKEELWAICQYIVYTHDLYKRRIKK